MLLGSGNDTFTVGGDSLRPQLPKARQEKVLYFDQSPAVMASIVGGAGDDTFPIISTVQLDRSALDSSGGLIAINTKTEGITGTRAEVQHISVRDGKIDSANHFTLTFNGHTTAARVHRDGDADPERAQRALRRLGGVTVTGGSGVFDVTFPSSLGNVGQLVATFADKLVDTSTTTQGVLGSTDEVQYVQISDITDQNGYFTVKYQFMETQAMSLGVSLADFQAAVRKAFTFAGDTTANINVTLHGTHRLRHPLRQVARQRRPGRRAGHPAAPRRRRRHRPLPRLLDLRGHVLLRRRRQRQRERQPERDHARRRSSRATSSGT